MGSQRTTIREVVDANDPAIAKAHRLLRQIFPKSELVRQGEWRETLQEYEAGLWTDIRWHLVIGERAGRVIGVATGTYLGNVNIGVIGYLAVSPAARHLGMGPRLRAKLAAFFQRDAQRLTGTPLQAIVGEVRRDNPWLRTLVRREGVLALDFPYLQPRLRRDEGPVSLVMYYESYDRVRRRLPTETIRRLLYTIWRRIYRVQRPMADAAFRQMLRALAGRRSVGGIKPDMLTRTELVADTSTRSGQVRSSTRKRQPGAG